MSLGTNQGIQAHPCMCSYNNTTERKCILYRLRPHRKFSDTLYKNWPCACGSNRSIACQSIDYYRIPLLDLLVSLKMGSGSSVILLILFHWSMLHSGIEGLKLAAYNVRVFGPTKVVAVNMITEVWLDLCVQY